MNETLSQLNHVACICPSMDDDRLLNDPFMEYSNRISESVITLISSDKIPSQIARPLRVTVIFSYSAMLLFMQVHSMY